MNNLQNTQLFDLPTQLMIFRTAYLKFLGEAWLAGYRNGQGHSEPYIPSLAINMANSKNTYERHYRVLEDFPVFGYENLDRIVEIDDSSDFILDRKAANEEIHRIEKGIENYKTEILQHKEEILRCSRNIERNWGEIEKLQEQIKQIQDSITKAEQIIISIRRLLNFDSIRNAELWEKEFLSHPDFKRHLPKNYSLPWLTDVYLVHTAKSVYNPFDNQNNNAWSGTVDVLVIKIPKKPDTPHQRAAALSAYYDIFATPFGSSHNKKASLTKKSCDGHCKENKICCPTVKSPNLKWESVYHHFRHLEKEILRTENYTQAVSRNESIDMGVGGAKNFLTFSGILKQMIAVAWSDPKYWEYLTNVFVLTPAGTPYSKFKDRYVEFENPWFFNIIFEEAKDSEWICHESCENKKEAKYKWVNLECNQIFLCYPIPELSSVDRNGMAYRINDPENPGYALALARYNATGPAYPFTCP